MTIIIIKYYSFAAGGTGSWLLVQKMS